MQRQAKMLGLTVLLTTEASTDDLLEMLKAKQLIIGLTRRNP
jgi:hypothetical protein